LRQRCDAQYAEVKGQKREILKLGGYRMKTHGLVLLCFVSALDAAKTRITLFNKSQEPILVSINTRPLRPLQKSVIEKGQAKNFFLERLGYENGYFIVIEGSSDIDPKKFFIHLDHNRVVLELANHTMVSSLDAAVLDEYNKFLKIVYRGSLQPELPEIQFVK
jgi:hypothetical protein